MDIVKILKRAWHIVWNYRALWVFGLIIALAVGGSSGNGGGNNGVQYREDDPQFHMDTPESFQEGVREFTREMDRIFSQGLPEADLPGQDLTVLLWMIGAFVAVLLIISLVVAAARYVSETAVIRMVDEYESTGVKKSIAEGFRIGWSPAAWRLFLINLIVHLPLILVLALLIVVGVTVFQVAQGGGDPFSVGGILALIIFVFVCFFTVALLTFVLMLFRNFFWRASVLEDLGVWDSLRRGFALVRENWKNVGLMWLVMIGLGIVWAVAYILAVILTIPVVIIMAILAALVAAVPALLVAGLVSLFLGGPWPWIIGILFALPLFFVIAFSPWVLLSGWRQIFSSSVWTLTYREIKLPPALVEPETVPADGSKTDS
jgi:hypothetical protein